MDNETTIRVCGADPSSVTGLVAIEFDRNLTLPDYSSDFWAFSHPVIAMKVIDIQKEFKTIYGKKEGPLVLKETPMQSKIEFIVDRVSNFCIETKIDTMAIEIPFIGKFQSNSILWQARLFQALVHLSLDLNIYKGEASEIHVATAKYAVRPFGRVAPKEVIRDIVEEKYNFDWEKGWTKPWKETITDAISVALGHAKKMNKKK